MARPAALDDADLSAAEAQHPVEIDAESASQGFKTGHMRWVLAIGFALACVVLGLLAVTHV